MCLVKLKWQSTLMSYFSQLQQIKIQNDESSADDYSQIPANK